MIAVLGESLVDLVPEPDGRLRAHLGGSPYNVARALGRQLVPSLYISPTSEDSYGAQLRSGLEAAGVCLGGLRSRLPTSLAVVSFVEGQPSYSLYREGIADSDASLIELLEQLPEDLAALHTGSLALTPPQLHVVQPFLMELRRRGVFLSADLNLRPRAVRSMKAYRDGIGRLLPLFDLVKASDEDLRHLDRLGPPLQEARQLLQRSGAQLVALTLGSRGAALLSHRGTLAAPAASADRVVDTIGAGDCFQAGLLRALWERGWLDRGFDRRELESLRPALEHAQRSAAVNVQRAGCQPPTLAELQ